jgi:hypothetical protein
MLKLAAGLRVGLSLEDGRDQVDAVGGTYRPAVTAKQGSRPSILVEKTPHRQGHGFRFVALGEPCCRGLDQCDDIGPVDGDDGCRVTFLSLRLNDRKSTV